MSQVATHDSAIHRWTIVVRGVIQGVGFRPFVYNAARARGLTGWVQNEADTVRIEVQGRHRDLRGFVEALRREPPPQARLDALDVTESPLDAKAGPEFCIRASVGQGTPRPTIPADLATCAACLEEIRTPGERRCQYPFTNCTNCGPRWSIIRQLPYDRARTSMAGFRMCPACEAEYRNPADRRFHAQPIACPECGPQLELLDPSGQPAARGQQALDLAARAVLTGQVVALKGLGGFQLLVDATDEHAVARLRQRKRRPDKPFAVMLASLDEVRARCQVSDDDARTLQSAQAPILLLRRRGTGGRGGTGVSPVRPGEHGQDARVTQPVTLAFRQCDEASTGKMPVPPTHTGKMPVSPRRPDVAAGVAPGNPFLGVMLPYTPLHHLLMERIVRPMVCTSGNLSEEPMAITTEDALARLGTIADVFLVHDRPIVRSVDDSVAWHTPEGLQLLRRARGFSPLPIDLGRTGPTVLAVGGHLKNTVALSLGSQVVLSQHVGDLDNVASVEVHQRAVQDLVEFFCVTPDAVACDLHPDYASTRYAEAVAARWDVPLVRVQHHHAHVAACMAEHGLEGPVLGLAWDGTGYGPDGTVWGGEALECRGSEMRRVAHLRTFPLPGGDRAVREPRRSAIGLLFEVLGPEAADHAGAWFSPVQWQAILRLLARPRLCPRTSSLGRLFDAVAALCGLASVISFEGHAAMALEFAADADCRESYPFPLRDGSPATADWEPAIRAVLADRAAGEPLSRISARFHNALAEWALAVAQHWGGEDVVLSGGCFQNALLSQRVRQRLQEAGLRVHAHRQVPPNDGGIALGQAAVASGSWGLRVGGWESKAQETTA